MVIYWISPFDLGVYVSTSVERVVAPIVLALAVVSPLVLAEALAPTAAAGGTAPRSSARSRSRCGG